VAEAGGRWTGGLRCRRQPISFKRNRRDWSGIRIATVRVLRTITAFSMNGCDLVGPGEKLAEALCARWISKKPAAGHGVSRGYLDVEGPSRPRKLEMGFGDTDNRKEFPMLRKWN